MKIHSGTDRDTGLPSRWIEPRTDWQFTLDDLVDGLCSHYIRDRTYDDGELPSELSLASVIGTVKQEYAYRGTSTLWTWRAQTGQDVGEAEAWARALVLAVLPSLESGQ